MKKLTLLMALVLSAATLLAAEKKQRGGKGREAVVKAYDANKNGKLDKEEEAVILKEYDANGDGKLDKAEKKKLVNAVREKQKSEENKTEEDVAPREIQSAKLFYPKPKYTMKDWKPVKRTTDKIVKVEEDTVQSDNNSWKRTFYRNMAYKCGLSGNYTFVVIEPVKASGKKAPLWVYFHGGGGGYFQKDGSYMTLKFQNKDSYNHEETFETLGRVNAGKPVFKDGRLVDVDNTLTRRVKEGYRLLVVAYGDHDQYSGMGTPYPNNPKGGEVNGLQASMSAVEYTVANYPTTYVFAHGTSAGSTGCYALGFAFAQEGINLTGVVMDSSINTPRRSPVIISMAANNSRIVPEEIVDILKRESKEKWLGGTRGQIAKVGVMINPDYPYQPEAAVKAGYRSVPMLVIAGKKDPFFGARAPVIPEAKAAGLGNVAWLFDGLRQAIEKQKDSHHKFLLVNSGHVPTVKSPGHLVNNDVDKFIKRVTSSTKSFPFEKKKSEK